MIEHFGLRADDVLYCPFPLFHLDATRPDRDAGAAARARRRPSASASRRRASGTRCARFGATVFDFMGATLTMLHKRPPAPDDADNPARLAWGVPRPRVRAGVRGALRPAPGRGLRLDRRRRADLPAARRAAPPGQLRARHPASTTSRSSTSDDVEVRGRRGGRDRRAPQRAVAHVRRLLRHARGDASRRAATSGSTPATSPAATPTATSTSSAGAPTRSGGGARTSPPSRSRRW